MIRLTLLSALLVVFAVSSIAQSYEENRYRECNEPPADPTVWGTDRVNDNKTTDVNPELPRFKKHLKRLLPKHTNSWGLAYSTFGGKSSTCVELHAFVVSDPKNMSLTKYKDMKTSSKTLINPGSLAELMTKADFYALKKDYKDKSPLCFECPTKRLEIYRINPKGKREYFRFEWIGLSKNGTFLERIYSEALKIS